MKLTNIKDFNTIQDFVSWKLEEAGKQEINFSTFFEFMFSESDNIMAEISEGYQIKRYTYGECKAQTLKKAFALKNTIDYPKNSLVGIYMDNSLDWIKVFWSILLCGYKPLLLNMRVADTALEQVLTDYDVKAVISDDKVFSVKTIFAKDLVEGEEILKDYSCGEEIIFMSSGTTEKIKLCAYTADNLYCQVANSVDVLKICPEIARHYEGQLKQLTLLPFYHVFGFIAVYLWFGFFSRTFVFLKDLNPKTIQNTIKRHKVTHFFAVPLVWESVYKAALRAVKSKGEKTYKKFCKGAKIINNDGFLKSIAYKGMKEVRDGLFGDSIQFLISGGGFISKNALEFFNGIGYHLANGFGMTEVGITSVEISNKAKVRNKGSIGSPFKYTQYKIDENGILCIKGKNVANRIMHDKEQTVIDREAWFCSNDIAVNKEGGYYLNGRSDDLIVPPSGENVNPQLVEQELKIKGAEDVCLIDVDDQIVLLVMSTHCYSGDKVDELLKNAKSELERTGVTFVNKIVITPDNFLSDGDFKLNRRKIKARYKNGQMTLIEKDNSQSKVADICGELEKEVKQIFAEILSKTSQDISLDSQFFNDLGGSSLEYFMLADAINAKYGVDIKNVNGKSLISPSEVCDYIKSN